MNNQNSKRENPKSWQSIFTIGLTDSMPPYLYGMGYVFNLLNFTGFIIGLIRFVYLLSNWNQYEKYLLICNALPALLCITMAVLMARKAYSFTVAVSFIFFPLLLIYLSIITKDRGLLMFFVPYMIYCFFFLNSKKKILAAFSAVSLFFISGIVWEIYNRSQNRVEWTVHNGPLEIISLTGALVLTFISMYSIKFQLWKYQEKIKKQKEVIERSKMNIEEQNKRLHNLNLIKDKLFSIISHDLRVPLVSIQMMLESLGSDESFNTFRGLVPELNAEMKKTNELFTNLINWTKLQLKETTISLNPLNVYELTASITEKNRYKAEQKGVALTNEVSNTFIHADKDVLEIVLRNLLSNAIKFTGDGGSIHINGAWQNNNFVISISDTGKGMSSEVIEKIHANNFYTSPGTNNEKGTGLGIVICKDLIEQCKGTLSLESEEGVGTTFSIVLPQA